jgi:quercetin dioxygenase-like cupin family protein
METAIPLTTAEVVDLAKAVTPPTDGIISHTIYQDSSVKAVLFGFGQGQELSEHTASKPAIMHFLTGESEVTLGDRKLNATEGTWVHMAAGQPHSIVAKTPATMLLLLLK